MLLTGRIELNNSRGFTFLEVLIVLSIIGIATGVVLPLFGTLFTSTQGNIIERKMINIFQKARTMAVVNNNNQEVIINQSGISYNSITKDKVFQTEGIKKIKTVNISDNRIVFFADGSSTGGKLIVICDKNTDFSLKIDQVTGKVEKIND